MLLCLGLPASAQDIDPPAEIRIGIPTNYLPLAGINLVGEPSGLATDLWRLWSQKTGIPVTFEAAPFSDTVSMLRHDQIDVHAALFRNETRGAWLHFTRPFHEATSGFYILRSRKDIETADALAGRTIGVVRQTHQEGFLRYNSHGYRVKTYSGSPEMLRALMNGNIDAILHEDEALDTLLQSSGVIGEVVRLPGEVLRNAVLSAFKQNRPALRTLIDWGFSKISRDEYAEIEARWIVKPESRLFQPKGTTVAFNEQEQAFLAENKVIRVGMINNWPPMNSVDSNGNPVGMSTAVATLINERLGGIMTFVPGKWNDLLEDVKAKRLDAVFDIAVTQERIPHFRFSHPYLEVPYAIMISGESDDNPLERDSVKIAIERGYATIEYVREAYPDAILQEFESTRDALTAVARGEADVYVGNSAVVNYLIAESKQELGELRADGELESHKSALTVGVRHDWPVLRGIFDKAIMGITPAQMESITDPWFGSSKTDGLQFTSAEKYWLSVHKDKPVRVLIEDWPPFNYERNGEYAGMAVDYVRHALEALELKPEFVRLPWSEALESIRNSQKIDLIPALSPSPERAEFLDFTHPYLSFPTVIFTRDDFRLVSSLDDLAGQKVAVEKGFIIETRLKQDYPAIELFRVDTSEQAIEAVSTGQADAYVGNLASGSYFIQERGLSNIKVAAPTGDANGDNAIGVRRDWPELASLLDKVLLNMSPEMHAKIRNSALAVQFNYGVNVKEVMKYAVPAGIAVLVIISVFLYANRKLAGEVSERRKAEQRLTERESWFRSLLESAPDATLIVDSKGTIVRVNRQAEILFGYNRSALVDLPIETLVPDNIKRKHVAYRDGFITSSAPREMGANLDLLAKRNDGSLFPVEISLSPIETINETLIAAAVRDVTDRRAAEKKIADKEKQLREIIDSIPDIVFVKNLDGVYIAANAKFGQLLNLPPEHIVGRTDFDIFPDDVAKEFRERDAELIASGMLRTDLEQVTYVDGRVADVETTKAMQTDTGGKIVGLIGVARDVTERKKEQETLAERTQQLHDLSQKLSRYLSPQIYDAIFAGADASVRTERKKLTVFFSDIKNFTATTEEMEPEDMTYLLNDYLTKMTEIALEHGGTIDKYIGDAIMVFFGDPETKGYKQDALQAVRMAIAMQRRMIDLRAKWSDMGYRHPFHIRCGVNTGFCNVGNFGSEQRIDYTIIGGQVNLAARLEGICEPDGVMLAHETYTLVRDEVEAEAMEPIQVKGIREPVTPYAVQGIFDDWDETERYIRKVDVQGMRLWIDLMRQTEEERLATIRELQEAIETLQQTKPADTI